MGKRTKSARKAARKSSSASVRRRRPLSSSFLVFPIRRERGNSNPPIGETHSPLKNGSEFPTARFWSCYRRPRVRRRWPLFFLPPNSLYSHLFLSASSSKKNRNPLDRDSARPRVKATKSGPNRKRMRSPPG